MNEQNISECTEKVCPVETTLEIIGGKWKGIIIYRLLGGTKRFSELKRKMPTITHRMLTLQLRQLESDGIVNRRVYAEVPPKVEYSLTDLGLSMAPIIRSIHDWGKAYQEQQQKEESIVQEQSM